MFAIYFRSKVTNSLQVTKLVKFQSGVAFGVTSLGSHYYEVSFSAPLLSGLFKNICVTSENVSLPSHHIKYAVTGSDNLNLLQLLKTLMSTLVSEGEAERLQLRTPQKQNTVSASPKKGAQGRHSYCSC